MICSFVNVHQPKLINALFRSLADVSHPLLDSAEMRCPNKFPIWALTPDRTAPFVASLISRYEITVQDLFIFLLCPKMCLILLDSKE